MTIAVPDLHEPLDLHEPRVAAKAAGLRHVSDRRPGITRERKGEEWVFRDKAGTVITDDATIERIRKLAIPPAYTDVWICADPRGHLQAVGRDARGRKQYRYHPQWRVVRDQDKYGRMLVFGRVLPQIRARVRHDLRATGLPKRKVLAAIVALLEKTMMRVGNEEYARENKSFGLTTLRDRHVKFHGGHLELDFRGKHGIDHHVDVADTRLARVVRQCRDLPGQDLFQFLDHDGERHHVSSDDVNHYLHEASGGEDVTAKDFRTWAATNLAAAALREAAVFTNATSAKHNVVRAVEHVAKRLGNTPTVCRKCYIHPALFDGYLDGSLLEGLKAQADDVIETEKDGLTAAELAVVTYLRRRLDEAIHDPKRKALRTR